MKLTKEEAIKDMRERIKPDTTSILKANKKFEAAIQKFKNGDINKEQFMDTINAHTIRRKMTLDEYKCLPVMDDISSVINSVKVNEATKAEIVKAFLGPYRTRKQIIMDKHINKAALMIGSIKDDKVVFNIETIDVINDTEDENN